MFALVIFAPPYTFCHLALSILDVFHGTDCGHPVVVIYSFSTIPLVRVCWFIWSGSCLLTLLDMGRNGLFGMDLAP